jgi:hypothetical protein
VLAANHGIDLYLFFRSENGFLESQSHVEEQVVTGAGGCTGAGSSASPKTKRKEILKNISKGAEYVLESPNTAEPGASQPFVTVGVINATLLGVSQNFIGFGGFLELLLRLLVSRISIRVVLESELAIGLLHLLLTRLPRNTQDLVIIPFLHSALFLPPRCHSPQVDSEMSL